MEGNRDALELHASLAGLEAGLDVLHASVQRVREAVGRGEDDGPLMEFEIALAEIGGNALTHTGAGADSPVEYVLRWNASRVVAWLIDPGPQVNGAWIRDMPPPTSEAGRGIPLARSLLDELHYERVAGRNRWRLVKRL